MASIVPAAFARPVWNDAGTYVLPAGPSGWNDAGFHTLSRSGVPGWNDAGFHALSRGGVTAWSDVGFRNASLSAFEEAVRIRDLAAMRWQGLGEAVMVARSLTELGYPLRNRGL